MAQMTIAKTQKYTKESFGRRIDGKGFVMYGRLDTGKWFERHYASREAAQQFATNRGWTIKAAAHEHPAPPDAKPRIRLAAIARQIN